MQKSLENLPEINVETDNSSAEPSLMEAPAQEEEPNSLMARPTGV